MRLSSPVYLMVRYGFTVGALLMGIVAYTAHIPNILFEDLDEAFWQDLNELDYRRRREYLEESLDDSALEPLKKPMSSNVEQQVELLLTRKEEILAEFKQLLTHQRENLRRKQLLEEEKLFLLRIENEIQKRRARKTTKKSRDCGKYSQVEMDRFHDSLINSEIQQIATQREEEFRMCSSCPSPTFSDFQPVSSDEYFPLPPSAIMRRVSTCSVSTVNSDLSFSSWNEVASNMTDDDLHGDSFSILSLDESDIDVGQQ
ncbi:hypothetical protein K493DRAFT_321117 [Basidiobolus meristosporus CBS 931.73]|uniref:Uncharacterized protein n=1 Tax=Basidiobolus meristosporus CBS 931.73 TaxID=1314790 RepID=A0A1Y1WZL1_9FUNG|nr:hypothetical protein K493DRAFT_321117 [Basidiobolus meristosporus CBS 931.73]|eukprot:ORX78980.1 hypothetical protein K493DRAFT_321117 [Basidiobolus meristosporus CBS 931.73]